ncbi:MAG: hypothetical protein ACYC5H_18320 [Methylovirgula sp.]
MAVSDSAAHSALKLLLREEREPVVANAEQERAARLKELLVIGDRTGIDVRTIRDAAETIALEEALRPSGHDWHHVLSEMAACIPGDASLRPLEDPSWREAINIGKSLADEDCYPFSHSRIAAVAAAVNA